MRISLFPTVLSLIVAGALSWLAYDIAYDNQTNLDVLVAIGTCISVLLTLGGAIAFQIENIKVSTSQKVWSGLMFFVMLIVNFCFANFGVKIPWYPITTICLLVLHIGVARSIINVKDV